MASFSVWGEEETGKATEQFGPLFINSLGIQTTGGCKGGLFARHTVHTPFERPCPATVGADWIGSSWSQVCRR